MSGPTREKVNTILAEDVLRFTFYSTGLCGRKSGSGTREVEGGFYEYLFNSTPTPYGNRLSLDDLLDHGLTPGEYRLQQ